MTALSPPAPSQPERSVRDPRHPTQLPSGRHATRQFPRLHTAEPNIPWLPVSFPSAHPPPAADFSAFYTLVERTHSRDAGTFTVQYEYVTHVEGGHTQCPAVAVKKFDFKAVRGQQLHHGADIPDFEICVRGDFCHGHKVE